MGEQKNPLQQYRDVMQCAQTTEAELGEYVQAIEEFGLDLPGAPQLAVQCRRGLLPPAQIRSRAQVLSVRLEQLLNQAALAREQVLTEILRQSKNLGEYRAMRQTYVDSVDAAV